MPSQQDIDEQQELLATHRATLAILLRRLARLSAAHAPPEIFHGIAEARAEIQRVKAILAGWGVDVADHPDDTSPQQDNPGQDSNAPAGATPGAPPAARGAATPAIERSTLRQLRRRALTAYYKSWGITVPNHPDDETTGYEDTLPDHPSSTKRYFVYSKYSRLITRFVVILIASITMFGLGLLVDNYTRSKFDSRTQTIPTFIPIDPKSKYTIRIYNCDDVCRIFINDNEIPIIEVRQGEDSEWIDITRFINNRETIIKFQVINTGGFITYGFQIRKNAEDIPLTQIKCGLVNSFGCDKYKDPPVGVVAEFLYKLVQP